MYFNKITEWIYMHRNSFTNNDDYDSKNVLLENENNNGNNEDEKQIMR
jgi:hypothetical protein